MGDPRVRRAIRRRAYEALRTQRPHLFANPPGAAYEIVFDEEIQNQVADEAAGWLRDHALPEEHGDIGVVYQDKYLMLVRDAVRFRDGSYGAYIREMSPHDGPSVAVLTILPDGRIALLRHFRHATRAWHWEIPRGFGEPGSTGHDSARRELAEELSATPRELILLGLMDSDTGAETGAVEIFLAYIAELPADHDPRADPEGIDDIRYVTSDEFLTMIRDGTLTDSFTLTAYAYATARGLFPNPLTNGSPA